MRHSSEEVTADQTFGLPVSLNIDVAGGVDEPGVQEGFSCTHPVQLAEVVESTNVISTARDRPVQREAWLIV